MYVILMLVSLWTAGATEDLCPMSMNALDSLLSRTKLQLPHLFSLPDKVGLVGIYRANLFNLDTFARDNTKDVQCSENSLLVPIVWLTPPTGSFVSSTRLGRALRKVFQITVGLLEATLRIDLDVSVAGYPIARLNTLAVTRLGNIKIVSEGFGLLGGIVDKASNLLIGIFTGLLRGFLENTFKVVIRLVMISIPIRREEVVLDGPDYGVRPLMGSGEGSEFVTEVNPSLGTGVNPSLDTADAGSEGRTVVEDDGKENQPMTGDVEPGGSPVSSGSEGDYNVGNDEKNQAGGEEGGKGEVDHPIINDAGNRESIDYDPSFPYEKIDPRNGQTGA